MAKVITDIAVQKVKPAEKRREIPDGKAPGLYLVVQPSGAKSWAFRYRLDGKPKKLTLGAVLDSGTDDIEPVLGGAMALSGARQLARNAANDVARGIDPAAAKRRAAPPVDPDRDLVKNVIAEFLRKHFAGKKSLWEVERMFRHDVLPYWSERRIQEIGKRDVIELLDRLTERGVGSMTNRVFSIVRKLMNWAVDRDILTSSPCAGLKPPAPEVSRDRVLSDDEVRWFWRACDDERFPFGSLFKLLLLTGQRESEVAEMRWSELNIKERMWTIPRERVKNDKAHDVALSDAALAVIEGLPKIASKAGLVFTTTTSTPVSGFGKVKGRLDLAMLEMARKEAGDPLEIPPWRLHDLRRTAASGMARLGIHLPVIEKVLNHTSGSFAGIVGVYQRHSFADEKRSALEEWGRFIASLVEEREDNIISLRAASNN